MTECERDECQRPVVAKGLCRLHYTNDYQKRRRAERRAIDRPCLQCGKSLAGKRPNAMFCSDKCKQDSRTEKESAEAARMRVGRRCATCGGPISDDSPLGTQTCSRACGVTYQNAKRAAEKRADVLASRLPCADCGGPIPEHYSGRFKFCSPECKKRAHDVLWRVRHPGYNRMYLYGLDDTTYAELLASQDGACAICRTTEWTGKGPHVDHDHTTGKVRGILCHDCNLGLGRFRDDPDLLRAAVAYLM